MSEVSELYKASADGFWGTMTSHSDSVGFRIPEYQRAYNWGQEHIERLLENTINGLQYLTTSNSDDSYTFLGTLILVSESEKEPTFDGQSMAIVDGQQRLTTLVLIACSLIEAISSELNTITTSNLKDTTKQWLDEEARYQQNELYRCVSGQLPGRGTYHQYPRLIRSDDARARELKNAKYSSVVSRFLYEFGEYYVQHRPKFDFPSFPEALSHEADQFKSSFKFIQDSIRSFTFLEQGQSNNSETTISHHDFERDGIKCLFEKLGVLPSKRDRKQVISEIKSGTEVDGLVRLILFASYIMHRVVLTRVETNDESTAFDIFDSLNTTGQSLTAIETLKPRVILYEKNHSHGYAGSESESAFESIDEHLTKKFGNPNDYQKETKELIVSFAIFLKGERVPKLLSTQRKYLRNNFNEIERKGNKADARRFVSGLAELARFRHLIWSRNGIENIVSTDFGNSNIHQIRLCFRFILDMNTSLAIPPLARYWYELTLGNEDIDFLDVLQALTAFILLRRAATGNTANIDSDLRKIMAGSKSSVSKSPLCIGLCGMNKLPNVVDFKQSLIYYLEKALRIDPFNRSAWVKRVSMNPLHKQSGTLTRFLLLAAADHSQPDENQPGMWSRTDAVQTDERKYLTYENWVDPKYSTVEHIAPESRSKNNGWDSQIYEHFDEIHTLGNLTLLPQPENSSVGNSGWERKKLFYLALMESSISTFGVQKRRLI